MAQGILTGEKRAELKPVSIELQDEGKVNLTVLDNQKGQVDVEIYKESGQKVFEESIRYNKSFTLPIDLSLQDQGTYRISVRGDDIKHEQNVFNSKMYMEDVIAEIREVEDGKYMVKVLHDNTPVTVTLSDSDKRILYKKTYHRDSNFEQLFDVSQLRNKDLTISISGRKSYIREIL